MKYLFFFVVLLGFFPFTAMSAEPKTITFYDGVLSLEIPEDFLAMSDDIKARKYIRGPAPEFVYMDETTKLNIAVGRQFIQVDGYPADVFADAMWVSMKKLIAVKEEHRVGSQNVNGNDIGVIEFTTPALESDDYGIYNSMSFVLAGDVFYMISFNCTTDFGSLCVELGNKFRESIQFNK